MAFNACAIIDNFFRFELSLGNFNFSDLGQLFLVVDPEVSAGSDCCG
jgi:hypothetical protein